jgi:hypothetical protein
MVFNATFNNSGGQFYWSRKPEYQEKTTDEIYQLFWVHLTMNEWDSNSQL